MRVDHPAVGRLETDADRPADLIGPLAQAEEAVAAVVPDLGRDVLGCSGPDHPEVEPGALGAVQEAVELREPWLLGVLPEQEGHGLVGMRERAVEVGGTVECGREPGGTWVVDAHLPLRVPR